MSRDITLFHYATLNSYRQMSIPDTYGRTGLIPRSSYNGFPTTYAFLEPIPKEWLENNPKELVGIILHAGPFLLSFQLKINRGNVAVVDWGLGASDEQSEIPLLTYLENGLHYQLPEIHVYDAIPLENIRVHKEQPLLEVELECLRDTPAAWEERFNYWTSQPELEQWAGSYKRRKNGVIAEGNPQFVRRYCERQY